MQNLKGRSLSRLSLAFVFVCLLVAGRPFAQDQIQKAKIFEDTSQLITDTDLYGSFFMMEEGKPLPDLRIIGAERMNEKVQLFDFDLIYLSKGQADGIEIGQLFQIIGLEDKVPPYGTVTLRREGRASSASRRKWPWPGSSEATGPPGWAITSCRSKKGREWSGKTRATM